MLNSHNIIIISIKHGALIMAYIFIMSLSSMLSHFSLCSLSLTSLLPSPTSYILSGTGSHGTGSGLDMVSQDLWGGISRSRTPHLCSASCSFCFSSLSLAWHTLFYSGWLPPSSLPKHQPLAACSHALSISPSP